MNTKCKNSKSVLLLCSSFFGYEKRIRDALSDIGMDVYLHDERPNDGFISKSCIRLNVDLYRPFLRRYYRSIISRYDRDSFDYVLVITGEAVNEQILQMLREAYPRAEFILYLWDSVINIPDCRHRMKLYDRVLTFDPADAETFHIPFLSVPYGKEHTRSYPQSAYEYDIAFVGTAHTIRPRVVKEIVRHCAEQGKKCFTYFYSPHVLVYLANKLINPSYRYITLKDVHFKPLSIDEVCQIYAASRCVLDIEHTAQYGSTPRTVEMLPMKRKVITTNASVKNSDFYHENNFLIIDRADPRIDIAFFDTPYVPVGEDVLKRYSPEYFARRLFPDAED